MERKDSRSQIFELDVLPGKGSLHAKIINVDNNFVGIGSANNDLRTFLYDTNNLTLVDVANYPEVAPRIFNQYIGHQGQKWNELTGQRIDAINQKILSDPNSKIILKALKTKHVVNQL